MAGYCQQLRRWSPPDGGTVKVWLDERGLHVGTGYDQDNDQSGNGVNFANATAAQQPATGRTLNGYAAPDFDGTNDSLDTTASGKVLSAIAAGTGAEYEWFTWVDLDAVTGTSATTYLDDAVFADTGQYFGLFIRNVSGVPHFRVYTWDTNDRNVDMTGSTGVHTVHGWHDGTNINGELDGAAGTPVACTGIGSRTALLGLGHGSGSTYFNGAFGGWFCYAANLSTEQRQRAKHYVACKSGKPA
jgi:hypothetical protein